MEQKQTKHRPGPRRRRRRILRAIGKTIKTILLSVFTLILVGALTAGMLGGIFYKYVTTILAPSLEVDADDYTMQLSSFIYYQDKETGEWIELQTIHGTHDRIWVDYQDIPEAMWQAAVAIEDHRFFQHEGVDWYRTGSAVVNMFLGMKNTFGGSTITQQTLKNMTKDDDPYVSRKVREIFRAMEFEKNYTKEQILELYLNMIYLGKGCYGVQTAAQFYFGKDVSELSVAECASLIAITNNPSLYGPMYEITYTNTDENGNTTTTTPRELNKQRQINILKRMGKVGLEGEAEYDENGNIINGVTPYLTAEEVEAAIAEPLNFTDGTVEAEDIVAAATGDASVDSWFVDEVLRDVTRDLSAQLGISVEEAYTKVYNNGYHIYTTMDPEIQAIAESVYENRSNLDLVSKKGQRIHSGITIIDPQTGNVVAQVGDIGEKQGRLLLNWARAKQQPGSSLKPLTVYSPAIEYGVVHPGTTFDDYPVRLEQGSPWPYNSPNKYLGWTSLWDGLRRSVNTVAVQTLNTIGVSRSYAYATENLMLDLDRADMDESPLGMGGLTYGLNTEEMAAAYAVFANGGIYNSPRTYVRVTNAEGTTILENEGESHVAIKETTAYLMNNMLTEAVNSGTGTSAKLKNMTVAGKTGTTTNDYDRYFVGYTPYYVAAVWTGYEYDEKISYSGNPSITMWKLVMEKIHQDLPNKSFPKPSIGIETITVCKDSGMLCTDACRADSRGDRSTTVEAAVGSIPTKPCDLHVVVDYCTEGKCLATENCPAASRTQLYRLDHERVDYYKTTKDAETGEFVYGNKIGAEDDFYNLDSMKKAIGLLPTLLGDGTETYPEIIGCPVHRVYTTPSVTTPNNGSLYDDPNYDGYLPSKLPTTTLDPNQPFEDDPTGGFGDGGSWWQDLFG